MDQTAVITEYTTTVNDAQQVISKRSAELQKRGDRLTIQAVQIYKDHSRNLLQYEEFTSILSSLIPSITSSIESLTNDLNVLGEAMAGLEEDRKKFISAKNDLLIQNYEQAKSLEYESTSKELLHESNLLERWVKEQREKQLEKAIVDFKQKTDKIYEEKLKQAILGANSTPFLAPSTITPTPTSSVLTSSNTAPLATTPTKTPLIISNNTTNPTTQTPLTTTTRPTTASSTTASAAATTASAIELLEKYSNGLPFDDDYIQ